MKAFKGDPVASGRPRPKRRVPAKASLHLAVLLLLPGAATAQVSYEASIGLLHNDNINYSESDPTDESVLFGSLRFVARRETPTFKLRSRGDLRYLNYLGDSFSDEVRGELAGQLDWTLLPDRVHWVLEDYLSRQSVDVLGSPTPGNQQQVNVFVTGPSFFARLGSATRAQIDLRYTNSYAEETESFNGDRFVARGRILRELSPTMRVSFNLEAAKAEFREAESATDYKRFDAYVSFERELPALELKADLGYTRLEPSGDRDSSSAALLRTAVDWRISSRTALSARVDYQFADAAQDLIRNSSEFANETYVSVIRGNELDAYSGFGSNNLIIGADAYRERWVELGYRYRGDRMTVRLHPYVQRLRYEAVLNPLAQNLDRHSRGEALSIDYRLRPQMTLSFGATNEKSSYRTIDRTDRDWSANVALADRSSRRWRWRVEYGHSRRDSSATGASYTDNTLSFTVTYRR